MDCVHAEDVHDAHATSRKGGLLEGREIGAITYPAFKQWMSHGRFRLIKKYLCLSDYSISSAAKARDKLWKARDTIIVVRD
eukprot:6889360-Ditylum_brightwellii.AAC.1